LDVRRERKFRQRHAARTKRRRLETGFFQPGQKVVLLNTGSGLKYVDVIAAAEKKAPQTRAIVGIIGPY
jgi:threonine synthase